MVEPHQMGWKSMSGGRTILHLELAAIVVAVAAIMAAPGPDCAHGAAFQGRPFPYSWSCLDPRTGFTPPETSLAAMWANALTWGTVFGSIVLCTRQAQAARKVTRDLQTGQAGLPPRAAP